MIALAMAVLIALVSPSVMAADGTSTDYIGIAAIIAAFGAILLNQTTARAARKAQEVKDAIAAEDRADVKKQLAANTAVSQEVKAAVDGQTTKLVAAVEAKASAEGQLQEKAAQAGRDAAVPVPSTAESPKIAAAQAIIDKDELKQAVAAAVKEALAGMHQPVAAAPGIVPHVTIEKVVAGDVEAKTVTTDNLVTGKSSAP